MIINDVFFKDAVAAYKGGDLAPSWLKDLPENFRRRRLGTELLYDFMYAHKLLPHKAIWANEYVSKKGGLCMEFSIDTECLEPYKAELLSSPGYISEVARDYLWPEAGKEPTPCIYCGAVSIAHGMSGYRDTDGCIGRSWECCFCNHIEYPEVAEISDVRKKAGDRAAQTKIYEIFFGKVE